MDRAQLQSLRIPNVTLGETLGEGAFGAVLRGRNSTLDIDAHAQPVSGGCEPKDMRQMTPDVIRLALAIVS